MALAMSTELASSVADAALNSAPRPSRAAPVAAAARIRCSPRSALSVVRSVDAGVVDVGAVDMAPADMAAAWPLPPDIPPDFDVAHPAARSATVIRPETDFAVADFRMFVPS